MTANSVDIDCIACVCRMVWVCNNCVFYWVGLNYKTLHPKYWIELIVNSIVLDQTALQGTEQNKDSF